MRQRAAAPERADATSPRTAPRAAALAAVAWAAVQGCALPTEPEPAAPAAAMEARTPHVVVSPRETFQLGVTLLDEAGETVAGEVRWTSDDPDVADVSPSGALTGVAFGATRAIAHHEALTATVEVTVTEIQFASVDAGGGQSCGVSAEGVGYCWGGNFQGQLGSGSRDDSLFPVAVAGDLTFAQIAIGFGEVCGVTTRGAPFCWGRHDICFITGCGIAGIDREPVAVWSSEQLVSVGVSRAQTCGLTSWGGVECFFPAVLLYPVAPEIVSGQERFESIAVGLAHICGLTAEGRAMCWGNNGSGALGVPGVGASSDPVEVDGDLVLRQISGSGRTTCGLTEEGRAHCWGESRYYQLGVADSLAAPRPIHPELSFATLSVGSQHICGVTTDGVTYCWGEAIGSGTEGPTASCPGGRCYRDPVAVGGPVFTRISAGSFVSCGVTSEGSAYCWGRNEEGQLGDGTTLDRPTPVRVRGSVLPR